MTLAMDILFGGDTNSLLYEQLDRLLNVLKVIFYLKRFKTKFCFPPDSGAQKNTQQTTNLIVIGLFVPFEVTHSRFFLINRACPYHYI